MSPTTISARVAAPLAVLGGALWIVRALLGAGDDPLAATLRFVGLAALLVSVAVYGTTLVRSDATGTRVVVALASALLFLSMTEAFRPVTERWYYAVWGALAVLLGGVALLRRRGSGAQSGAGAHAG